MTAPRFAPRRALGRTGFALDAGLNVLDTAPGCDPDVALLGLSFPNEQDAAFGAAEAFTPLSASELGALRERAALAMRDKGAAWWNPA
jgi:hypothetical protein